MPVISSCDCVFEKLAADPATKAPARECDYHAAMRDALQWVKSDIGNYGEITSSTMDLIDAALRGTEGGGLPGK